MAHPLQADAARADSPVPPRTPYEEAITAIWREVLDRSDIGVLDDFFDLDGTSLRAIQVIARIRETWGVAIKAMDFFDSPTVAALAEAVAAQSPSDRPTLARRGQEAAPVLSFDQQRLWLEEQLRQDAAYHVHGRQRLLGDLDVAALEASVRAIVARHEILRTRFPVVDGQPVQVVDEPDPQWRIRIEDLTGLGDERAAATRLADADATAPFDLERGPLLRCTLLRLSGAEHVLSITAHHIICDDWSVGLFIRELSALYQAGGDPGRAGLPDLPIQYRDYAAWQRQWLAGEALERQVSYWRQHLAGAPPALALPDTGRRTQPEAGNAGGRVRSELPAPQTAELHEVCRRYGVTSFMALLAGMATVLGRWAGQPDVVIGVPITGRTDAGTENLIGFFVNTLPLRLDLSGDPSFAELLTRVRAAALGGYANADAPFDLLVRQLPAVRVPGRTPVFQVVLNVLDTVPAEQLSGVSAEAMAAPTPPSKFDLAVTARESRGGIQLDLEFDPEHYPPELMEALLRQVVILLQAASAEPTRGILDYPLRPDPAPAEPATPPAPAEPAAPHLTVAHLAVARFARSPERIAVLDPDGAWTYDRLNRAADQVADRLANQAADRAAGAPPDRAHPDPDHHVDIVRRPTAGFIAAILGCLKAGATFSIVDGPDSGSPEVLDVSTMDIDVPAGNRPHHSPGTPATAALTAEPAPDWSVERFGLTGQDRFAVLSGAPGHLLSALSSATSAGATLVLGEPAIADDPAAVREWLQANSVSVVYLTPPILRALAAHGGSAPLPALRYAFIDSSRDLLWHDVEALRRLSETCQCVGVYRVGRDGRPRAVFAVPPEWTGATAPVRIPLGTELPAAPVRLLHPSGQPAAVGEVAELCFGTYRTGDLGRRWSDGLLELVGRRDGDPGGPLETVAAMREAPEVRDAVVTATAGTLVGYVTGPDPAGGADQVHQHLVTRLPEHLLPGQLMVLDRIPLTPDGEYDLSALPQPRAENTAPGRYVAPRTPMERQLVEVLQELLNADRIGVYDSFFELGGFSLLATQLTSRIRDLYHVEIPLRAMFESATVDGLSRLIVAAQAELAGADDLEALLDEIGADGHQR